VTHVTTKEVPRGKDDITSKIANQRLRDIGTLQQWSFEIH